MIPQQVAKQGFLWGLAAIYLFAFTSLYVQIPGLYGDKGLLPASYILHDLSSCQDKHPSCVKWASTGECQRNANWMATHCMKSCNKCQETSLIGLFKKKPTLLWLTPALGLDTTAGMEFLCLIGIILSMVLLVSQRCRDCLSFFVLWSLYFSLFQVGQIFLWYQWDGLLLETGFLAIIIAPWNIKIIPWKWKLFKCKRTRNMARYHDAVTLWLVKWLLFRLMFASGVVKLSFMDPTWWSLTAMYWHYESQCIPTPVAWYFQKLPKWLHRLSVVITYVIEIGLPFLFFAPVRALRLFAYFGQVLLQLLILLTGNYNFFNLLTLVLCVTLLDDKLIMSRNTCSWSPCTKTCRKKTVTKKIDENHSDESEDEDKLENNATTKKKDHNQEELSISTTCKILDRLVDFTGDRYYGNQLVKIRDFLSSKAVMIFRKVSVIISCIAVFTALCYLMPRWFYFELNNGKLMSWIAFSPEDFRKAVAIAVSAAIWIGLFSLLVEIMGAYIRILLQSELKKSYKIWSVMQCTMLSLVSLWIFAISLDPLTDVSARAKENLPQVIRRLYRDTEYLEIAHPYGLFRSMTGVGGRPEIIILGSNTTNGTWKEYNFRYKPGNVYEPPPFVAPHQPRLDWQMWFAALESYNSNPWFLNLLYKLLRGEKDVLALMGNNKDFGDLPPKYIRTQLFLYHYTGNSTSLKKILFQSGVKSKAWWTREYVNEYTPFIISNDSISVLEQILKQSGVYRRDFAGDRPHGFLHSLITSLRRGYKQTAPQNLISLLLFLVVTLLVFKVWWRKMGKRFCTPKLIRVKDKCEPSIQQARDNISKCTSRIAQKCSTVAIKSPIGQCYRSHCVSVFVERISAFYRGICSVLSSYYNRGVKAWNIAMGKLKAINPSLKKKE